MNKLEIHNQPIGNILEVNSSSSRRGGDVLRIDPDGRVYRLGKLTGYMNRGDSCCVNGHINPDMMCNPVLGRNVCGVNYCNADVYRWNK